MPIAKKKIVAKKSSPQPVLKSGSGRPSAPAKVAVGKKVAVKTAPAAPAKRKTGSNAKSESIAKTIIGKLFPGAKASPVPTRPGAAPSAKGSVAAASALKKSTSLPPVPAKSSRPPIKFVKVYR